MEKKEEQQFLELFIKLRCVESGIAEMLDGLKTCNEILKKMILKRGNYDAECKQTHG